jgi:hypothetical protein
MGKHGNRHSNTVLSGSTWVICAESRRTCGWRMVTGVGFCAAGDNPEEGCLACAHYAQQVRRFLGIQLEAGFLKDCLASKLLLM